MWTCSILLFVIIFVEFVTAESMSSDANIDYNKIAVTVSEQKPFVKINQHGVPTGLDVHIINAFARKFNLSVDYSIINDSLNHILCNKQHYDDLPIRKSVSKSNILIGGIDGFLLADEQFAPTNSYYHDELTWCVQKSQPIAMWKRIFRLCSDLKTMAIHAVMCFSAVFMGYWLQQFENQLPKWDWIRISCAGLGIMCGAPFHYPAKNLSTRLLIIFCTFGCMIFLIIFTAFMQKALTTPFFESQIKSIKEMESFEFAGDRFALHLLRTQNQIYSPKMINSFKVCENLDVCLRQLIDNEELAVAVSREYIRYNNLNLSSQIYCFDKHETLYNYALTFLVRNDFNYTKQLNAFIQEVDANGLVRKWRSNVYGRIENRNKIKEKVYNQFGLKDFYGMSIIGAVLALTAVLSVLLERFVHKKTRKSRNRELWRKVERLIDSKRYFMTNNYRWN